MGRVRGLGARAGALLERTAIRDWRILSGVFFASTFLESLAMGHLNAFTPLFLRDELHLQPDDVRIWTGLLAAATFGVAFPLAPLWGSLAERYSRKLLIVRSQYLEAIGYTLCGLAPDLGWFLAARLLLGLTFGNIALVIATQSLLTPERRSASAIAVVQAANPIAVSLGPPLGALLLPWIGLRGLFFVDAAVCLLAALLVTFLMPEPPGRDVKTAVLVQMRASLGMVWRRPVVRWNFLGWYLTAGAMRLVDTYLPVRIAELVRPDPAPAIGIVLGVYGAFTTLATWIVGRVVDRVGPSRLFWPGMTGAALAVLGIAVAPWLWLVALFAWLRAVPVALTGVVLYAHLTQVLDRRERAPVMSLTPLPRNLASFTIPFAAAWIASAGTAPVLILGAAAYGLAAWVGRRLEAETPAYHAVPVEDTKKEAPPAATPL